MTISCDICKKEFKYKYLLIRHSKRKFPCKELGNNLHQFTSNSINLHQFTSAQNDDINQNNNNSIIEANNNKINCKYCNLDIIKNNLTRHQRTKCDKIPNYKRNILIDKYNNHKATKKQLVLYSNNNTNTNTNNTNTNTNNTNNINNTTNIQNNNSNNNITNNIQNNINNNITVKINPLGQEDLSFLTQKDKKKLLMKKYMGVPELIKMIYDIPSNRNIYQPNVNKKILAFLNENNEIEYGDYNNVCERIVEDNIQRLDDFFYELEEEINGPIKTRLLRVLEENLDGSLNDKYIEDIKYHILNISKRNKKELNEYLDKVEKELKVKLIK